MPAWRGCPTTRSPPGSPTCPAGSGGTTRSRRRYELPSFPDAIAFVTRVGFLAEKANHHPDLDVRWRKVRVGLSTHDEGGITGRDLGLAGEIESVAAGPAE